MQSKWLDAGMKVAAFHLQSKAFDSRRPPPLDQEAKENSVVTRERLNAPSPSQLEQDLKNREVTDEDSGDLGGSRKRLFMNSPSAKSFRVLKNKQLNTNEADDENPTTGNKTSLPAQAEFTPSFFIQEAAHLLSLLSAVAFSTLRSDIEGVETPLTTFRHGIPWPPVDPDKMDTEKFSTEKSIMKNLSWLFGKGRTPETRTL